MPWPLRMLVVAICLLQPAAAREPPKLIELRVVQQTTDYTCGPAVAVGFARFHGIATEEMTAALEMGTDAKRGTTPDQFTNWLKSKGLKVVSGENGTLEMLRRNVGLGIPTLVEWIDWGGHWVVVVGIDDKGTEATDDDDFIFADPWDRIDGVSDGLTRFNIERFDSMWFDAFLFERPMKRVFIYVER